jgi:Domain of unknown function (DUF6950)
MIDKRCPNWDLKLDAAISAVAARPFQWGAHDCCTFAADIVKAITGRDPMKAMRGYKSEAEARAFLKQKGWPGVYRALYAVLGKSVPVAQAQRGDVVFAKLEGASFAMQSGAGICLGKVSAFPGDVGLVFVPTHKVSKAWPIGRTPPKRRQKRAR